MKCLICGKEYPTSRGFGGHITQAHKIKTKQYYDMYLRKTGDGFCKTCGKPTTFKNVVFGYFEHCLVCAHNTDQCKQKRKNTNLERYGVENVLSSSEIRSKAKKTMKAKYGQDEIFKTDHFKTEYKKNSLAKYGVEHPMQSKTARQRRKYYMYDDQLFDSSWELAIYIWHKNHNINIIREPCTFEYVGLDFKKHMYFPDFQINNQIIEVKGNQYLKENGKLKDEAKQICIDDHNVIIWSYNDVKPYISYCEELFNDKYWYKAFRYNTNYTPSHCKHTTLINTPVKCRICNKEFQNGKYLSAHLKFQEHITGKDYYDNYLKKPDEGICIVCGKPTKYINFTRGYTQTCSQECNNNPLSNKGKNISKTKQTFTEEQKQQIREKRENTCLEKYGVKSNLQFPESIEKSHSKETRQKANETRQKHLKERKEREVMLNVNGKRFN